MNPRPRPSSLWFPGSLCVRVFLPHGALRFSFSRGLPLCSHLASIGLSHPFFHPLPATPPASLCERRQGTVYPTRIQELSLWQASPVQLRCQDYYCHPDSTQ